MEDDKVVIKNIKLEYITTKKNDYDNEISYFKIKSKNVEQLFALINKENYKLPYFKTDDNKWLLKCKSKYVKLGELNKEMVYICDLEVKEYSFNNFKGLYVCKIS